MFEWEYQKVERKLDLIIGTVRINLESIFFIQFHDHAALESSQEEKHCC